MDFFRPLVLNIGYRRCGRDWNFKDVQSPFTRVYIITDGSAQVVLPTGVLNLTAGNMYIIPAFTTHSCRCEGSFDHMYIHLYNEGAAYILEDWDFQYELAVEDLDLKCAEQLKALCPGMELDETDPSWYDNMATLRNLISVNKRRPLADRVESRGLILQLLARFLRHATPKNYATDERISAILGHIRQHLSEALDLEALASLAHISRDHLIRLFKRHLGSTPRAYINLKRVEQAQLLLITEDTPVKEIAYSLGFEDPAYFNRLFRRHTGTTPLNYRLSAPV